MKTETVTEKQRFCWIDQLRGSAILYLAICNLIHWPKSNGVLEFLFSHAPAEAASMTLRDVSASAFIFIMGFLYGYAFHRHSKRSGVRGAGERLVFRYGLIFILGMLISFVGQGTFLKEKALESGRHLTVIVWDVLPAIGLVGLVGLPFLFLKPRIRLFAGYALMFFYQIMLSTESTGWKLYAVKSAHGGILAAAFSYSAQLIIASALGEYFFSRAARVQNKAYQRLALFAAVNLLLGFCAAFVPELGISKRQVSMAYSMIAMGITVSAGLVFVLLEKRGRISSLLDALGKNPFLIYLAAIGLELALYETILENAKTWVRILVGAGCLAAVGILAVQLHRRRIIFKTETVALWGTIMILPVAVVMLIIRTMGR